MHDESSDEVIQPRRSTRKRIENNIPISDLEIIEEKNLRRMKFNKEENSVSSNKLKKLFEESESNFSEETDYDYEIDDELFKRIFGNGNEYKIPKYEKINNENEENLIIEKEKEFSNEEIIKYVKLKYDINDDIIIALKEGINVNYVSLYYNHNCTIHLLFEILDHIKQYKNYIDIVNKCKIYNSEFNYKQFNSFFHASNQLEYLKIEIKDPNLLIGRKLLKPDEFITNLETKSLKYILEDGNFELNEELINSYALKISKSPIFYKIIEDNKIGDNKIKDITKSLNIFNNLSCLEIIKRALKLIPIIKLQNLKEKIFNEIFSLIINNSYCKLKDNEKCCIFTNFNNLPELTILDSKYNYISKMHYNKAFSENIKTFLNSNSPEFIVFVGDSKNTKIAFDDIKENNPLFSMFFYYCKYFNFSTLKPHNFAKLVTIPEIEFLNQIHQIINYFKSKITKITPSILKKTILNSILTAISFCGLEYNYIKEEPEIFNYFNFCFPKNFKYKPLICETINEFKDSLFLNDLEFKNFSTFFRIFNPINENTIYELLDSTIIHPEFYNKTKNLLKEINISLELLDLKIIKNFYELNKMSLTELDKNILSLIIFSRPIFKGATNKQVFKLLINFDKKYLNKRYKVNIKGSNKNNSFTNLEINGINYPITILTQLEGTQLIEIKSIDYNELKILAEKVLLKDFSSFTNNSLFDDNLDYNSAKQKLLNSNKNIIIIKDNIYDEIRILCKIGKNSIKTFNINSPENFNIDDEIFLDFKEFKTEYLEKFLENIEKIYKTKCVFTEKSDVLSYLLKSKDKFCFYLTPLKKYDMLIFKNNIKNKYKINIGKYIHCKNGKFTEIEDLIKVI